MIPKKRNDMPKKTMKEKITRLKAEVKTRSKNNLLVKSFVPEMNYITSRY